MVLGGCGASANIDSTSTSTTLTSKTTVATPTSNTAATGAGQNLTTVGRNSTAGNPPTGSTGSSDSSGTSGSTSEKTQTPVSATKFLANKTYWLESMTFTDAMHGYLTGFYQSESQVAPQSPSATQSSSQSSSQSASQSTNPMTTGMLFETQDGGQNWQLVYTGGSMIPALSAVGAKVWVTVEMGSGSNLKYQTLVSNNPANSESAQTNVYQSALFAPVSTKSLLGLDFDSASDGWAITQSQNSIQNNLLHTVDGGKSWITVKTPKNVSWGMITGVYFRNPKTGWLLEVGEPGAGQEPKAVFQTKNGGQTWNKLVGISTLGASTPKGSLGSGGYAAGIDFSDATTGWLWEQRGGIYQTTDGGRTWQLNPIGKPEMFQAQSITFLTPNDGMALFWDNGQRRYAVEKTSDGGQTWSVVQMWPIR